MPNPCQNIAPRHRFVSVPPHLRVRHPLAEVGRVGMRGEGWKEERERGACEGEGARRGRTAAGGAVGADADVFEAGTQFLHKRRLSDDSDETTRKQT